MAATAAIAAVPVLGATAATAGAQAPAPYKVLVVTSATDALSTAGVSAITSAVGSAGTVTAPPPAAVGAEFTPAGLDAYRVVVFLNTGMASPLTDAQRAIFETYFKKGGSFVGIGSAVETDPNWAFLTNVLGTRASGRTGLQSGTVKVFDRVHDASKNLPQYWDRTDHWYNFAPAAPVAGQIRGNSHVLASVVEDPYGPQPQGQVLDGIAGGTMGANHPISFCKDYQGGRSFYTGLGNTPESFDASLTAHLKGAITWAAGQSDPAYSDCGATVLRNYQQVKVSAPPNLLEPIGFDQLPDGRVIQTARSGTVRLHNPATGTTQVLANFADTALPLTQRLYTNSEDGLYGPAVDNNFAQNKWVYLYYSPMAVTDVTLSDGTVRAGPFTTPTTAVPNTAASPSAWDPYIGYFQLSRFKFVDDAPGSPAHLDMTSEQQILRVSNNRQECCHVAGDIDFDKHNNLWMATGDDTPAGGIRANGYGPFEDELTDEQQTVRVTNATGGTFTLTFNGQTTAPLPFSATAAQVDTALEALSNIADNEIQTSGGPVNTANVNVFFRRALKGSDQPQLTSDATALTGATAPTITHATAVIGGLFQRPTGDDRRSTLNSNDLRGKLLRVKVKDPDIAAANFNKVDLGSGSGAYTIPSGNLFPLVAGAPQARTAPEVYAMGFRNPFRLQVDENDVAYVSDYSPDANAPARSRGPSGVGRFEIVRKPANYGYPVCYSSKLGYYRWNFQEFAPGTTTVGTPLDTPPQPIDCGAANLVNDSRWVRDGGPGNKPGLALLPPVTDPDIWNSYNDNRAANPLGTPCFGYYATAPGPIADGSSTECPRLFPELYTGGVGPHGIAKYHYNPANPNPKKFPPYYDESVILGEFTQDTLREVKLDSQNRVQKINGFLDCGQFNAANPAGTFECDNPMDMQFGADGAFYLLTYGDGFFAANPDAGMYRWDYVKGQRAPSAVLTTDRTDGAIPLTVNFSSVGSADADPGDSIRYEWNFGDGTPISTEANPTHIYTTRGRYTAVLKVLDSSGQSASTSTIITAGNTSPTITIEIPPDGGFFEWGQTVPYKVKVTDPEDASIDCSKVQVTFVLVHDQHGHAEQSKSGCTGWLDTDAGDASHGGYLAGGISVTYADTGASGGVPSLSTTKQHVIQLKRQQVEFAQQQSGTAAANPPAGETDPTGAQIRNSLDPGDWIAINNSVNLDRMNKAITFRFGGGSATNVAGADRAAVEIRSGSATGELLQTVVLKSTGANANTLTDQTFGLDPTKFVGSQRLFFVFRAITGTGVPANNFGSLNWIQFSGDGFAVAPDFFPQVPGNVGGSVPATLSLSLGTPAAFGAFTPGVARDYVATTTANVISTAGDATLSVADPSPTNTGSLMNGSFFLPQKVQAKASSAGGTGSDYAAVGGSSNPTTLLNYGVPISNDAVTIGFKQAIGANDALRTGAYSKTLTFTLSTTTP